jgi:hypothetical protein
VNQFSSGSTTIKPISNPDTHRSGDFLQNFAGGGDCELRGTGSTRLA